MAQITITIPDDLAQRLAPFQNQFSDLFTRLITAALLGQSTRQQDVDSAELPNTSDT